MDGASAAHCVSSLSVGPGRTEKPDDDTATLTLDTDFSGAAVTMDWTGIRRYIATERLYELEILPTELKGDVLIVFVAWPPNTSREERIASELRQSIPGTARVDFVWGAAL